ncbi:retrovirus-related pol polyprotein from transposon TNT 1-94 [Tanacetum coccineum]
MAAVNDVPQLVDKKMEPYYIKCIKDDPFQPKTAKVDAKPESQWTPDEGGFEGPLDTKENMIMDLKLKYQTFRAKSIESLSQNYTRYKTMLNIYGRFVYEDNLIQRRYSDTKKALITTPSSTPISIAFFSNNIIHDFQENSDDEVRCSCDDELTVGKSHARNGEWVDITIRKVDTLLSINEDADWQNYLKYINIDLKFVVEKRLNLLSKYNKMVFELNKCRDELQILKQAKPDAVTFQIQNTKLTKLNYALHEQLKEEKNINEKWLTSSKKVSQCISEQIPHQKKKVLGGELFTASSSKMNENENLFVPTSMSVSGTVSVSETKQTTPLVPTEVNSKQKTQESNSKIQKIESSKSIDSSKMSQDSKSKVQSTGLSKSLRTKPIQKPQLKCKLYHYTNHSTDDCYRILHCMICKKEDHRTSDHEMYIDSLKRSENYKAQPYQYASSSKQILKAKVKPFPPCIHYGFNDHRPNDCRNYPECEIYGSYDHSTLGYNYVIQIRGGVLAESSQSNESSIGVIHVEALYTPPLTTMSLITLKERQIREPIWYMDNGCSRSMTGVKIYLHKYVEQPGPKQGTIFNANKEIVLIAPRRNDVYVLDMLSLTPNGACFFAKASESVNWLWHKRLSRLNFLNINKLAKQNKVLGLPSLVYSKDKP